VITCFNNVQKLWDSRLCLPTTTIIWRLSIKPKFNLFGPKKIRKLNVFERFWLKRYGNFTSWSSHLNWHCQTWGNLIQKDAPE
jgi:hypothetical protein